MPHINQNKNVNYVYIYTGYVAQNGIVEPTKNSALIL